MKTCIILGAGPSIQKGIELGLWDKIVKQEIWSLNSVYKVMPYLPDKQLWVDVSFYRFEVDNLEKLHNQGVKLISKKHSVWKQIPHIKTYSVTREKLHVTDETIYLPSLGLTGMFALGVAIKQNYDQIFILGYDFGSSNKDNKNTHFYQNMMPITSDRRKFEEANKLIYSHGAGNPNVYYKPDGKVKADVKEFEYWRNDKNKIWNVSPESRIECFEKIDYPSFFKKLESI